MEHDKHIAGYALEAGRAVILVVNKWDAIENRDAQMKEFTKKLRNNFQFMPYAPIVFLSALTKRRIHTLMPNVLKVAENHRKELKTTLVNDVINDAYALNIPPSYKSTVKDLFFPTSIISSSNI
jgi:GTP-binding protein